MEGKAHSGQEKMHGIETSLEAVPADALRIACNVLRDRLRHRNDSGDQSDTVTEPSTVRLHRHKRRREARDAGADGGESRKRRHHGTLVAGSTTPDGQVGPRLDAALRQSRGRAISEGGLSHYFLHEAFRRATEISEEPLQNPPASSCAIHMLPSMEEGGSETHCCSICYDDIEWARGPNDESSVAGTPTSKRLPCGHAFHARCIEHWLHRHNTCPCCRAELETVCPIYNAKHKQRLVGQVSILPRDGQQTVVGHVPPHEIARRMCQWPGMSSFGISAIRRPSRDLKTIEPNFIVP